MRNWTIFLCAILLSVVFDQGTKYLVTSHLLLGQEWQILPFLSFFHARNVGIAFSMLSAFNNVLLILITLAIIVFVFYLWMKQKNHPAAQFGFSLVIGGAIGNLIDRVRLHYVVDFIYFHIGDVFKFAIFNVADSCITIGALLIIIHEIFLSTKKVKK